VVLLPVTGQGCCILGKEPGRTGINKERQNNGTTARIRPGQAPGATWIEVDVSPTGTSLTYEQIYTSGPTFEEALITFLGEALSRYEALRKRSGLNLP